MSRPDDKLFKQFASSLRHKQVAPSPPPVSPHKAKSKPAVSDIRDRWTLLYVEFDARSPTMTQVHADIHTQDMVWRRHLVANKATLNEPRTLERDIVGMLRKRGHPFCRLCTLFTDLFNQTYASQQMGLTVRSTKDAAELLARAVTDVRKFQQYMQVALLKRYPETDTRIGRECGRQAVQEALFPFIFHNLFEMYKRKNFYRDAVFAAKLAALEVITTEDMGVSSLFQLLPPAAEPQQSAIIFTPPVIDETRFKVSHTPAPSPRQSISVSSIPTSPAAAAIATATATTTDTATTAATATSTAPSLSSTVQVAASENKSNHSNGVAPPGGLPVVPSPSNILSSSPAPEPAAAEAEPVVATVAVTDASHSSLSSVVPSSSSSSSLVLSESLPSSSASSVSSSSSSSVSMSQSTSVTSSSVSASSSSIAMPLSSNGHTIDSSSISASASSSSSSSSSSVASSALVSASGPSSLAPLSGSNFTSPAAHRRLFSPLRESESKTPSERLADGARQSSSLSLATRVSMPSGGPIVESKQLTQSPHALAIADSLMSSPLARPSQRDLTKSLDALSSLSSLSALAAQQAGALPPILPSSSSFMSPLPSLSSSSALTSSGIFPISTASPLPVAGHDPTKPQPSSAASLAAAAFASPAPSSAPLSSPFMVSSSPPVTLSIVPTTPTHASTANNITMNGSHIPSTANANGNGQSNGTNGDEKRSDCVSPSMMPSLSMAINELGGFADPLLAAGGARSFTDGNEDFPYQAASQSLRQLSHRATPRDKLSCILIASQDLCTCVDNFYKMHDDLKPSEQPCINADDLLSLCAYILIKSRLPYAISEAGFIEDFVGESLKMAMSGYYLATLQAAIELINGLDKDKLIANMEGVRSSASDDMRTPAGSRQQSRRGSRSTSAASVTHSNGNGVNGNGQMVSSLTATSPMAYTGPSGLPSTPVRGIVVTGNSHNSPSVRVH